SADQCVPDSLFVAIPGLRYDGHDFITEAIKRGARYIVHEKEWTPSAGTVSIRVPDSRRALGILAKNYFGNPSAQLVVIAVTGTSGKTTTTYLLESIFSCAGFNCGVLGTVNYRFNDQVCPAPNTTPESCEMQKILREMADGGVTHVIAEVSSHAIDLKRIDDCDFDVGVFTNLSSEHLDYHLTMESYYQAKKRLFTEVLSQSKKKYPQKMIINADDNWGKRILNEVALPALAYGFGQNCAVRIREYHLSLEGIDASLDVNGETISVRSALIGKFNLYNIAAAAAVSVVLGLPATVIRSGIEKLTSVPGRLEKITTSFGAHVFVDYAHKPDALTQVLHNLSGLRQKKIITVFGCGGNRDRIKRPMMGQAATQYSDLTIITSDNPRLEDPMAIIGEIEQGVDREKIRKIPERDLRTESQSHLYTVIPDRRRAIEAAVFAAEPGDIILIAGKGHEDYQILGDRKINFDDRVVARESLRRREGAH
ncbi:MAG TPA: UDP-N-acetylmuramoyl-L-alanyl-D-glutamate--2,6-diaminopimelate ligase, partial [Smithella sp.]|nr:UDP-N-acetylmuramoyl-L-alanyl-D-glutamate--2,6-diaminopimelate ligase [Smithella sp.]